MWPQLDLTWPSLLSSLADVAGKDVDVRETGLEKSVTVKQLLSV